MTTHHITDNRDALIISVEHGQGDSFSRSVDRKAHNEWKRIPRDIRAQYNFIYGRDSTYVDPMSHKCTSHYIYKYK